MLSELDFKKLELAIKCMYSPYKLNDCRYVAEQNVLALLKLYTDTAPHDVEKYYDRETPEKPVPPPNVKRII